MSAVFELAAAYVDALAELDPNMATLIGITGHDHHQTDYSPSAVATRAELDRATLAELESLTDEGDDDRVARDFLVERLGVAGDLFEAGEWARDMNTLVSPLQLVREVFDVADTDGDEGWLAVAARLGGVPGALTGWRESLSEGLRLGVTAARRQALACADQTVKRAPFFTELAARRSGQDALGTRLAEAAASASQAYLDTGVWLREVYAEAASPLDGIGDADRYRLMARGFLGSDVEPGETYEWGWSEVRRIGAEMESVAATILPDATLAEVFHHLEQESDYAVVGSDALREWAQAHVDRMIAEFGRDHFHIAEEIRRCTVNIGPGGGSTAPHYTPPSEDLVRPGGVWYPDLGEGRHYALWRQATIANHEAVPGHHLQVAQVMLQAERLSRFQRLWFVSGHGEGWALYAERLCRELGFLDRPEAVLGYLSAEMLRAVRVVVDIGLHLRLAIPADSTWRPGERWTRDLAVEFAAARTGEPLDVVSSEIDRYLGWPGQAISYKVGEREWLAARDDARAALGADFDLERFHTVALDLGPLGLAQLRTEIGRRVGCRA